MVTKQSHTDTVDYMLAAKRVVVLTGAGVSKESGIPTFRDAQTGLWAKYDPQQLASPQGFRSDPALVWQWYDGRRSRLKEVKPNPGHHAISEMAEFFDNLQVVTQNVDGLHQVAGSKNVLELHGNISTFRCFDRGHQAEPVELGLEEPPLCHCGSMLRPGVVWFGEGLPEAVMAEAVRACSIADLLFVVGTSGLVYPAASLPYVALERGAKIVEVNPERTPLSDSVHVFIDAPSGVAMPELLRLYKERRG